MRKRLFALTLALVMALALLPGLALAADGDFVIEDRALVKYTGPGGDIVIPDGVDWIKEGAFEGVKNITGVVIPEGVVAIGGQSFSCSKDPSGNVTAAMFQDAYARYGVFANQPLTSVTLPRSLSYISSRAFGATRLVNVEFPENSMIDYIGTLAFSCSTLKSVSLMRQPAEAPINGSVDVIEAFRDCEALETVVLTPGAHYNFGVDAFHNCKNLKTIENAEGIYHIGKDCFWGCDSLENMMISKDLDPTSLSNLSGTPWFQKTYGGGEFIVADGSLVQYTGAGGDVVIPDSLGITSIGACGFQNATSVTIPEGVTWISERAFYGCDKLKTVSFPSTLRYIGKDAFAYCHGLNDVSLPDNVLVGSYAFGGCKGLTHMTFSDSVVFICNVNKGDSPICGTPFEETLLERQKGEDFAMIGGTLYRYQGPGGAVVLPAQTRSVGCGAFLEENTSVTSITYPKQAQAWLDKRVDESVCEDEHSALWYCSVNVAFDSFSACKRLMELNDAPVWRAGTGYWDRYVQNRAFYTRQVDPAKCLGTPADRIAAQSNAIVSTAGAVTDYDKARAIADWVAKNVKYDWGVWQKTKSAVEAVTDPEQVLNGAPTTCDGYTQLTNQLLWAQGIPANDVTGLSPLEPHAWTEAWIDGRWVIIDTTWMAPFMNGTQTQGYERKYFDMGLVNFTAWSHIITDRPFAEAAPAKVAYASTQTVLVDGSPVEFQAYALKDANGNDTNYIKLRDVASILNGTAVQFNVGWDGAVNIETGKGYVSNGSEMKTPFSGNRAYENATAETRINGSPAALDAIVLKDDQGGAYTYYKLRDLGTALGFLVDWTAEKGIFIETK